MKKTPPPFSLRLDPAVRVELEKLAAKDDNRSLSNYINKVLREHTLKSRPKR
jgi:hypothetical protein